MRLFLERIALIRKNGRPDSQLWTIDCGSRGRKLHLGSDLHEYSKILKAASEGTCRLMRNPKVLGDLKSVDDRLGVNEVYIQDFICKVKALTLHMITHMSTSSHRTTREENSGSATQPP